MSKEFPGQPVSRPAAPDIAEKVGLMQGTGGGGKTKVLLVEDDDGIRRAYKRVLRDYDVIEAVDGADGLKKFQADQGIRVVVTDYQMPKMNGEEMAGKIKGVRPAGIVMITSTVAVLDRLQATPNPNIDILLEKPVDLDSMIGAIEKLDKGRLTQ
ncbi:response regulator [Candidatus Altiarchaeota archaeon]